MQFSAEFTINKSKPEIWKHVAEDFGNPANWSRAVSHVTCQLQDESKTQVGDVRSCETPLGKTKRNYSNP